MSVAHLAKILFVSLDPIESSSERSLSLNSIITETALEGFTDAMSLNTMFSHFEFLLVKLEPVSDQQFVRFKRLLVSLSLQEIRIQHN